MSSSQPEIYQESIRSMKTLSGCMGSVTYSPGSEIVGLHISNMPNKMLWHTETYGLYTNGAEIIGLHMSNMPNKNLWSGPLLCMVLWI